MADKSVVFGLSVEDNASAPIEGIKTKLSGLGDAGQSAGAKLAGTGGSGGLVNPDLLKKLGTFKEKTEAGRQMLVSMGGAMGGVAGNAVMFGGQIAQMIGKVGAFEGALMLGVAAVGSLGYAVYKFATQEAVEFQKMMGQIRKETNNAAAAYGKLKDRVDEIKNAMSPAAKELDLLYTTQMIAKIRADEYIKTLEKQVLAGEKLSDAEKKKAEILAREFKSAERLYQMGLDQYSQYLEHEADLEIKAAKDREERTVQRVKKKEQELRIGQDSQAGMVSGTGLGAIGGDVAGVKSRIELELEAERVAREQSLAWLEENENQKTQIKLAAAQERARVEMQYQQIAMNLSNVIIGQGIRGLIQFSKAQLEQRAKEAGFEALFETAKGLAALAITWGVPNPASTGHFMAAAGYASLAAMFGIGAAASSGGGGGGGGGGGNTRTPSMGDGRYSSGETEKTDAGSSTIVINVNGHQFIGADGDQEIWSRVKRYNETQNPGAVVEDF